MNYFMNPNYTPDSIFEMYPYCLKGNLITSVWTAKMIFILQIQILRLNSGSLSDIPKVTQVVYKN